MSSLFPALCPVTLQRSASRIFLLGVPLEHFWVCLMVTTAVWPVWQVFVADETFLQTEAFPEKLELNAFS